MQNSSIHDDLLPLILSYLDTYSLAKVNSVSKKWNEKVELVWQKVIIRELDSRDYRRRIFGPEEWKKYGITIPLKYPKNLCYELNKPSPFFEGKTVGETSFVQFKVAGVGNCVELADFMKEKSNYYSNRGVITKFEVSLGDAPCYIVTETIIPDSILKNFTDQSSQITKMDPSYRVGSVFEISLVAFCQLLSSQQYMLNSDPPLYTRVVSTKKKNKTYNLGAFYETTGLTVLTFSKTIAAKNTGIIALKEILPPKPLNLPPKNNEPNVL